MACFWHNRAMLHRRSGKASGAASAVLVAVLLAGCKPGADEGSAIVANNVPEAAREQPVELPAPKLPLDREQLLIAVLRSATAAALGADDRDLQADLKNRRFEFRSRFGCPSGPAAFGSWSYDEASGTLRIKARTDLVAEHPLAETVEGAASIWGFTVADPWLLRSGCTQGPAAQAPANWPLVSIAQLFTAEDSRVHRPEPFYQLVKQVEPEDVPRQGLDLVLSGRLRPLDGGKQVQCSVVGGRPSCLISARIDRVAIEDPERGAILGEWGQR